MKVEEIILHHSATDDGEFVDQKAIAKYHYEVKGWRQGGPNTGGYHYYIERVNGTYKIIPGRPETMDGAHTRGRNDKAIGICLIGNFDFAPPPDDQLELLYTLIEDLFSKYGKLPINPHRKYANKSCPGVKFPLDYVITRVYNGLNKIPKWARKAWVWAKDNGINDGVLQDEAEVQTVVMLYKYHQKFNKNGG